MENKVLAHDTLALALHIITASGSEDFADVERSLVNASKALDADMLLATRIALGEALRQTRYCVTTHTPIRSALHNLAAAALDLLQSLFTLEA